MAQSSDPLFVGLTRPNMIFGVSLMYATINMLISLVIFVQKVSIYVLFVAGGVHLLGYILCFKEPLIMELYINRNKQCGACPNKSYYGAHSYSV